MIKISLNHLIKTFLRLCSKQRRETVLVTYRVTDDGGGDGCSRWLVVACGAVPLLLLDAVHSLSLSLLAAGLSPSLFSLFLFFFSLVFLSLFLSFSFLFFFFSSFSFLPSVASWTRAEVN